MFNGKIHYKWPFSIAMLVHQRVCGAFGMGFITAGRFHDAGMGRQPAVGLALLGGPSVSAMDQLRASNYMYISLYTYTYIYIYI